MQGSLIPPVPLEGGGPSTHSACCCPTEPWTQKRAPEKAWFSCLPGTQMAQEHPVRLVHQQVPAEEAKVSQASIPEPLGGGHRRAG